ncbi:MAG TPA: VOC family protein [Candidatus Binatia bacterium]
MAVNYVPEGHSTVSPYLVTRHAAKVIEMMKSALGGEELMRATRPNGEIQHAEVKIGDSVVMIGEANADFPPMPCMVHVYVPDCDAAYRRALAAGATSLRAPADQYYGDRSAGVVDVAGNQWWFATHVEDLSLEEIERRGQAQAKSA